MTMDSDLRRIRAELAARKEYDLAEAAQKIQQAAWAWRQAGDDLVSLADELAQALDGSGHVVTLPKFSADTDLDLLHRAKGIANDMQEADEAEGWVMASASELVAVVEFHAGRVPGPAAATS